MLKKLKFILIAFTAFLFYSCYDAECKKTDEWEVQNYKITERECIDGVSGMFKEYHLFEGEKKIAQIRKAYGNDHCKFAWQADNNRFVTLNICDNKISEIRSNKQSINREHVDSIKFIERVSKQEKRLSQDQVNKFVEDWNTNEIRDYEQEPFEKAFEYYIPYQYKILVYSSGNIRSFYGYNYVILDEINWRYEMSPTGYLDYFHDYWNK